MWTSVTQQEQVIVRKSVDTRCLHADQPQTISTGLTFEEEGFEGLNGVQNGGNYMSLLAYLTLLCLETKLFH